MQPDINHTTLHANRRIAQRGICPEALDLVCTYGIDMPAGNGCVRRELRQNQAQSLLQEGFAIDVVERALRTEAIYSRDEALITCYLRTPRSTARRARGKSAHTITRTRRA